MAPVTLNVRPHKMTPDQLHAQLGHFVLTFQAVEAAMVELIVQLANADPEYVATLRQH